MAESVTFEDKKLFGTVEAVFNTHVRALVLLDGGLWNYDVYMYSCGDICPGEFASDAASPMRDGDADYCTRTSANCVKAARAPEQLMKSGAGWQDD